VGPVTAARSVFADRADAGRRLGALLSGLAADRPVILGMARGGVPVADEVARTLAAPLDVVVVRKLGHPRQPELGLGALGEDGVLVVNDELVTRLGVPPSVLEEVTRQETAELERRRRAYRGGRLPVALDNRVVVVVDDGLATGFTARAAVEVARRRGARRVVVGVPVAAPEAVASLGQVADEVVCVETVARLFGISEWYLDFAQVGDDEVTRILAATDARPEGPEDRT
jgi:putative phosphoribosyl transferase